MGETILNTLREEHRLGQTMLIRIERAQNEARKKELYEEMKKILLPHIEGEKRVLYSRLRNEVQDESTMEIADDAEHENEELKDLLKMLDEAEFGSAEWKELFEELKEQLNLHIEEVETKVFTEAKEGFSREELEEMEGEFEEAKGRPTSSA